jgi:hypothetical protein
MPLSEGHSWRPLRVPSEVRMRERGFTTFWRVAKYWLLFIATVLLLYLRFIHGHPSILESCIYLALLLFIVMQKPMMATLKALSPP